MKTALAILISFAAAAASAKEIELRPPLNCGIAFDDACIVQQYVDTDPSDAASDYTCGTLSYDGHKGTDFRVPTLTDMRAGVPVVAAADGQIRAVRDGMADIRAYDPDAPDTTGRECGNGVVIAHPNGWETQYCHLKQGSISVAKGDVVAAGNTLGLLGLSGQTEFPHVHLSVRKDGQVVDPFNPDNSNTCNQATRDLWGPWDEPPYRGGGLLDVGFHDRAPEFEQLKQGVINTKTLQPDAPALILWAYMFGSRPGDILTLSIKGPDQWAHTDEITLERPQAELFRASGKRRPAAGWPIDEYEGTIRLSRDGELMNIRRVFLRLAD